MAGIMSKTYYVVVRVPCKIIGAEKFSEDTTVNIFRSQEMAVECLHKIMSSTKPEDDEFTLDHFSEGDVMSQLWSFDEDMTAGVVAAKAYLAGSIDRKTLVSISLRLWQTCQQKKLLNNKILENAVLVSYWLTYYIDLYVTADNKNSIATLKTISYNYIPAYTMKIAKDLATSGLLHIQNDTELNERRWQIEYARYLRQKDLGTVSALDHLS